tara:strand:+ start:847 stop:1149 length:303 start_codon:yes stop_codon:yes gene_type:complete
MFGEQMRVELSADFLLSWAHLPGFRDRQNVVDATDPCRARAAQEGPSLKNLLAISDFGFMDLITGNFGTLGAPGAWQASFMIAGSRVAKRNPRYNRFPMS